MTITTLRRTVPNELRMLQGSLNRMFEPFFGREAFGDEALTSGSWIPAVDIAEESDRLVVHAEVPGVKKEDLNIEYNDGVLSIRGERKVEQTQNERNYHRVERTYGTFVRSFNLPRTVDAEKIAARYEDGILEVTIPKREEAKPRQISINLDAK